MTFGLFQLKCLKPGISLVSFMPLNPHHTYTPFLTTTPEKRRFIFQNPSSFRFLFRKNVPPVDLFWRHCVGGKLGLKLFWTIFFDEENTLESNTFSPLLDGIFHQRFSTDWKILVSEHTLFFLDKNHVCSSTHSTHFVFIFGMLQRIIHPVSPSIR